MKETIQARIQNHVSAILNNISQIKKQNKPYIAATHEKELENIIEQIETLEVKTRNELEIE